MKHLDVNVGVLSGLLPASSTHPTSVTIRFAAAPMSHFTRRFLFLASRNDRQPGIDGLRESARDRHFKNRGSAMEDRLLYRVPEVALILNISRSKVYELFASGELESVKTDRIRLVRSSDLRAYVDQLHSVGKSA
jgi:excisionase family DNA binding protein